MPSPGTHVLFLQLYSTCGVGTAGGVGTGGGGGVGTSGVGGVGGIVGTGDGGSVGAGGGVGRLGTLQFASQAPKVILPWFGSCTHEPSFSHVYRPAGVGGVGGGVGEPPLHARIW